MTNKEKIRLLSWIRMNSKLEDRNKQSEVCFAWSNGGESQIHCTTWEKAFEWARDFLIHNPNHGLIVAEVLAVVGNRRG